MMINANFRTISKFAAPAALLSLAACATPFKADVTRFQQLPAAEGQTFAIKAANPKDDGGLEFSSYASLVSDKLTSLGYKPAEAVAGGEAADLTVTLDYGVDEGQERVVSTGYSPYFGHSRFGFSRFGFGHRRFIGSRRFGRFGGFRSRRFIGGFYDPFLFGGHGFGGFGGVRSFTVYTSGLDVDIKRNADGQSLFEGKAEAQSRSNKLTYLVPNLVEAMFSDFPGANGETVRISIAPEDKKTDKKKAE